MCNRARMRACFLVCQTRTCFSNIVIMTDSITERLGKCEVCVGENAKYTCPKCEVKTCSLKCVNIHKKELICNGIRDPTKFITMNNFTNVDVLNDYRMLEQVGRVVEGLHKRKLPREFRAGRRVLPKQLNKLRIALESRKINIKFLPLTFEKRIKNRTFLHIAKKLIYWDVEWVFPNADNMRMLEHGCCENQKISVILHKYLSGQLSEYQNEILHFYQASGASNVAVYLKAENVKGEKYYELDLGETVKDNLKGKTIVEYPEIYVVIKGHESMFETIESDGEQEESTAKYPKRTKFENCGNVVLAQLLNQAAKEETEKSRNLLFVTEYSDAELSTDDENT